MEVGGHHDTSPPTGLDTTSHVTHIVSLNPYKTPAQRSHTHHVCFTDVDTEAGVNTCMVFSTWPRCLPRPGNHLQPRSCEDGYISNQGYQALGPHHVVPAFNCLKTKLKRVKTAPHSGPSLACKFCSGPMPESPLSEADSLKIL